MFVLLIVLVTVITAIGMEMMPIQPAANLVGNAATHANHNSDTSPADGHHDDSNRCLYCHLAKATDLPPKNEVVTIDRRPQPPVAGTQTTSCHLPTLTTPCQPRGPPRSVAA